MKKEAFLFLLLLMPIAAASWNFNSEEVIIELGIHGELMPEAKTDAARLSSLSVN